MDRVTNVPPVADATYAIVCYHSRNQLTISDLMRIFDRSKSFCSQLLGRTREVLDQEGIPLWSLGAVSTVAAYQAWGIDIKHLEKGLKRLQELGLEVGHGS